MKFIDFFVNFNTYLTYFAFPR